VRSHRTALVARRLGRLDAAQRASLLAALPALEALLVDEEQPRVREPRSGHVCSEAVRGGAPTGTIAGESLVLGRQSCRTSRSAAGISVRSRIRRGGFGGAFGPLEDLVGRLVAGLEQGLGREDPPGGGPRGRAAAGADPRLDRYGRDLTAQARRAGWTRWSARGRGRRRAGGAGAAHEEQPGARR
jgi:hypothetical protein